MRVKFCCVLLNPITKSSHKRTSHTSTPGIKQLGSFEKVKIVPVVQVTSLLPSFTASGSEHSTSTTVPVSTGNCVVVLIVLVHSVLSPVQSGADDVFMN